MPVSLAASPDICVVGGGIVGLWTAFYAAQQGHAVTLVEKRRIGAGASGGLLGALMPHQPTGWNAKKQFQLDGLVSLEAEIAKLEDLTGMTTGYRRCGRLQPIRHAEKRRQSEQWVEGSKKNWPAGHRWTTLDASPAPDWLPGAECPHGVNHDTLSARVNPRQLVAALEKAGRNAGVTVLEETELDQLDPAGVLQLADGSTIGPGSTIVCAGCGTFALLDAHFGHSTGRGVKGQAALLRPSAPVDQSWPIIYDNGLYAIAHDNGLVAIGSTSENEFADGESTDEQLDTLVQRARTLSPALEDAEVVERWAGIRPRASGREPLVGPLPGVERTLVATGGFKISFGIAHLMAKAVLVHSTGETPDFLPDIFLPENRLNTSSAA